MDSSRILAWFGSALGNATLFGAIAAAWPAWPAWTYDYPRAGGHPVVQLAFMPYITSGGADERMLRQGPRCPSPHVAGSAYRLDESPLPWSFDPSASPARRLYACVRLDAEARIQGAATLGIERRAVASALVETINREWRFSPVYGQEGGWIAVRLNAGLPEQPLMPAYRLD